MKMGLDERRDLIEVRRPDDLKQLELREGRNEIVLGVADYFGGWGFICRTDDPRGIKIE